jgi:hypothetical protein
MTREQWREQQSRVRAERAVSQVDRPLDNPNPAMAQHGHGHADHGYQTTDAQQAIRVQTGATPGGRTLSNGSSPPPPNRAARFSSAAAEAEALGRGRRALEADLQDGQVHQYTDPVSGGPTYVDPATRGPVRHPVNVTTNHPRGFANSSYVPQKDPITNLPVQDATGKRIPVRDAMSLRRARVVWEYVPSTDVWRPVTYFPRK